MEKTMDYKDYGFDKSLLEKREALINDGVSIYPYSFADAEKIGSVVSKGSPEEGDETEVTIAGRITSIRSMGKSIFMDIKDSSGKIQVYLGKKNHEETWEHIGLVDIGDILGIKGVVFTTRMGELTVRASSWEFLSKAVVPIPFGKEDAEGKVYYRSNDPETKYRERYLNWTIDDSERNRMYTRSKIISLVRRNMEDEGFLEVATPTIEFVYGGAEARPFETSIWALGRKEAFLRISPELYLKRYIVGGFDKVFSICQNFRNEGIDASHNPEFTMIEWYEAFTDYYTQMERFENLVADVCKSVHGTTKITYQGTEIDFAPPWRRLTVLDALKEYADIDASNMDVSELKAVMEKNNIEYSEDITWGFAVAELFEELCEHHLIQPTIVTDHPIDISPLTKVKRGDARLVERFEPYVNGMEIGNSYSELTDPVDQLERLTSQRNSSDATDNENEEQNYEDHPVDADFVKAIGCGMPPTGGTGLGIDRLVMLLTDATSIRDIIPFPMIKPKKSAD
jgi:lysyl-tRNA synthetase class 2